MNFVTFLTVFVPHLLQPMTIEEKIKVLNPEIRGENAVMIGKCLREWMPIAGFTDENLSLSVMYKESAFIHKLVPGNDGEWGMLQVIPSDKHIQVAARKYRCSTEEIGTKINYTTELGNNLTIPLCRCNHDNSRCNLPNIGIFVNNHYVVTTNKLKHFLKNSPCGSIVTGLFELAFWKKRYESKLKHRYWTNFPKYLFNADEVEKYSKWWHETKRNLKDNVWVVHHNYGSAIKRSHTARWYPRMIYKTYNKLNNLKLN